MLNLGISKRVAEKACIVLYIRIQRLLGHADLQMATRYVQDVSAQTDRVIENSRKYVCQISE
jgi:integrase